MKRYYACLLGNWVDITDAGTVEDHQSPSTYFEDRLRYAAGSKSADCFAYDYLNIQYNGKNYRIHPSMLQVVSE